MKPIARTDRLIKQVVDQETLVYDPADDTACCLNALASAVWRRCDGKNSVEQIAESVAHEITLPDGVEAQTAVWAVLDELEQHHLILTVGDGVPGAVSEAVSGMPRRDVLRAALSGMVLFPSIQSIVGPTVASVTSPLPSVTQTPLASSPSVSPSMTPTVTPTPSPTMTSVPLPSPTPTTPLPSPSATFLPTPTPTPTPT